MRARIIRDVPGTLADRIVACLSDPELVRDLGIKAERVLDRGTGTVGLELHVKDGKVIAVNLSLGGL